MHVTSIEVSLLELPLREPFVASHGETSIRTITVARVDTDRGSGWGECSALPAATYSTESSAGAFELLATELGPRLVGQPVSPQDALLHLRDVKNQPMALACLEMGVLDAALKAADRSLADWLGVDRTSVAAGVSLGLDSIGATVERAEALAAEGYQRLKIKIQPGDDRPRSADPAHVPPPSDLALVAALRTALPAIELHLDANGAYPATALDRVCKIVDAGIDAFEQPFAPADRATAAALIDRIGDRGVPVVADEAVGSLRDARDLLGAGAMTGLSIKPARVGGLSVARKLHDLCVGQGLPATAGGMLETGLGRHALVAMAGLPGFSLTGDLSPAGRWLAEDPWPDLTMTDGRLVVPDGPGVAPPPDLDTLERHLVDRRRIV